MKKLTYEAKRGAIQIEWLNRDRNDMTMQKISRRLDVSMSTIQKWKDKGTVRSQNRNKKSKLNIRIKMYIYKEAVDRITGFDGASSRKIANKIWKKFKIKVSHVTVNSTLNKMISRPRKVRRTFMLTEKNKEARKDFAKMVLDHPHRSTDYLIDGRQIFFTDEKRFLMYTKINSQTNQVRICKKTLKKLKKGNEKAFKKVSREIPKYSQGFMVAAGLSAYGPGKLIFCVGTMNSKCYERTLEYFKEDMQRLDPSGGLFFQQDNASW